MKRSIIAAVVPAVLLAAAAGAVAAPKKAEGSDYGRDLISVATPGRQAQLKSGDCIVWTNAEGLGVGPAELGGLHGLSMHINVAPMAGDTATPFAAGLAELKAANPKAPAWLFAALEKHKAAIEARCAEDHPEPVQIARLTTADKR